MRTMACSSSKRTSASARASSVLPTPVGPRKMKLPDGRFGSDSPARARRMAFATALDRFVLTDDTLVQSFFQLQQFFDLAFHQASDRNTCPPADDLRNVFGVDLLLQQLAGFD